jgi:poly-beta-hydroxyalkanoate depolymerase
VPQDVSEGLYRHAGEPKRLVVLSGFGHYEVYAGDAFRQVMVPTLGWFQQYLPPL